ncbi:MAG: c-type cytochrome, partial [Pedosphaera parvula]|nr:c-type cytochrome [Pedosphaera parvula]
FTAAARTAALSLFEGLGALDDALLRRAFQDPAAGVREFAVRLSEPRLKHSPALADALLALAEDPDPKVRFRCALALGEVNDRQIIPALARIGVRDAADRWARAAVLSSAGRWPDELFQAVLARTKADGASPELMESLGQVLAASQPLDRLVGLFNELSASTQKQDFRWQVAAISGLADGLRARRIKGPQSSALRNLLAADSASAKQAQQRLDTLLRRATAVATDAKEPEASRLAAIDLLAHADYATAGELLMKMLGPVEPDALQSAAVHALTQMADPVVGKLLAERARWRAYSPAVREVVLASMLSQTRLILPLLDAIEEGVVQPWALTPRRRALLEKSRDKTISRRAEALFKNLGGGDRMKVYEEYKSILTLKPQVKNGHEAFLKACATCHIVGREGAKVGPDLTGVHNQPAEALLLHIIVPDAEILPGYTSYEVETKDGRTVTGLLASETPTSVTLRAAQGVQETILRSNIASLSSTSLSLMPQELEKTMSKQDLADLIGFLKSQ